MGIATPRTVFFKSLEKKTPENGQADGRLILKITDLSVTALKWM